MDAVVKIKLGFYALLMCAINISAVYYAFFYDGGSEIFADKGRYSFSEHASAADHKIPVTLCINDRKEKPIGNLDVILKNMSTGNASYPQRTNEKGIVQWSASQGFYVVEIYLNEQIIKKEIVMIDHKKQPTIQWNIDI